jgi:4-amino-4-deoxy-L-arabinose transferase-like glycosyltransferase
MLHLPKSIMQYVRLHPGPIIIAGIWFIVRMIISTNYGYFRDELYLLAAGQHLSWGYVDLPPLLPWIAGLAYATTGGALWSLHFFSALANAIMIIVAGQIASEFGGRTWAQTIAALSSSISLTLMATGSVLIYDSFDVLWWVLASWALIRIIKQDTPKRWASLGAIVGLGLLTKWTILFWVFALIVGLLLTNTRKILFTPRPWIGVAIALILFSPYVIWNATHDWATIEFMKNYSASHATGNSYIGFLTSQLLLTNPFVAPIWIGGIVYFLTPGGKQFRVFGWAYLILLTLFTIIHAKSYFLAPAYPVLCAGGSLYLERLTAIPRWKWVPAVATSILLTSGICLAPAVLPVMPPSIYGQYYSFLVANSASRQSVGTASGQPQVLADRFGWPEQVQLVAHVYHDLREEDQKKACIFASNYGEAGAILFFGGQYGLPKPISTQNTFYLWGTNGCTGEVVITVGVPKEYVDKYFDSATLVATTDCPNCAPAEIQTPIIVARHSKKPFQELWSEIKNYN